MLWVVNALPSNHIPMKPKQPQEHINKTLKDVHDKAETHAPNKTYKSIDKFIY